MKKILSFFYCLLLSILAIAQNNKLDELWKKYRVAKDDTSKARLLYNMHPHYIYSNIDSAFIVNKMALELWRYTSNYLRKQKLRKTDPLSCFYIMLLL